MSSEKTGQLITFCCDNCGECFEIAGGGFKDAWKSAKEDGWRCFQDTNGDWIHRCPECRGKK
jgi:hypothetical protein